jgi:hypothetical protein
MGNWDNITEEELEKFIVKNKDKFDKYLPNLEMEERFRIKLLNRFKKIISIVPHLICVLIVTVIISAASIWTWNSYIRKDRYEITLKEKAYVIAKKAEVILYKIF